MSRSVLLLIGTCLVLSQSTFATFTCSSEGTFPDPDNCHQFITCSPGDGGATFNQVVSECPPTLLFQSQFLVCDYCENVNCGNRPIPDDIHCNPETGPTNGWTTTTRPSPSPTVSSPSSRYPDKVIGMYIALADENVDGYGTDANWQPKLYDYQQNGANVLFFTFINPADMKVPKAFQNLAATKGTNQPGAVPSDTIILFAIGGYVYSLEPNPWDWLTSKAKAEAMAEQVARWPSQYGCDGIDLDIEAGAGDRAEAGPNMVHFIRRLRELRPNMIIGQPTYGFPQVQAEIDIINASWQPGGYSNNLADSIGLMVYEGTLSLDYVKNYAEGSSQWEGYPIRVDVPKNAIMVGCKGTASPTDIGTLASESKRQNLLGVMVWYASVDGGFQYEVSWDASTDPNAQAAYVAALQSLTSS